MLYKIRIGDEKFEVEVGGVKDGLASVTVNDVPYKVEIENYNSVAFPAAMPRTPASTSVPMPGSVSVIAPIPGVILDIVVQVGDKVETGQTVAIIEAMKMENNLVSSKDGIVREILVQKGAKVKTGDLIIIIG
ncbi:MAG: acetyl-CoA carboxylase biotin carboxyl carrier protein subunit [Desulfobacteraceae bacterium]|nr:MAG: acetyl-CoA carboxylase biotin carboxyl carrier protein subunit [Desulfobacteraceae bacterium]